jgi:hypothetical protein
MDKKKYLIILGGSPRGGEKAWNSLYKFVKNSLNADLAICTGDKWISKQSFLKEAKYHWVFTEPDSWSEYYNQNFDQNWKEAFDLGKNTGLLESGFIHFAIKDIILKKYIKTIKEYEYIIYSRFDQLYVNYHPHAFEDNILIPEGEDYFGTFDRHIMFPSKLAEEYFNILNFYLDNFKRFNDVNYLNCETVNKLHLESFYSNDKILRSKRIQFTVAEKNDKTNWRVPKYKLHFSSNLKIKYPDEFIKSVENLNLMFSYKKLDYFNLICEINYFYLMFRQKIGSLKKLIFK